jgi:hypothetical protein
MSPKPYVEGYTIDSIREDYKKSTKFEKFKVGERAIYIPNGFGWKYFPIEKADSIRKVKRTVSSDNGCAPYSIELPAIMIKYGEEILVLDMNNEKKAEELLSRLQEGKGN